jgi:hypothetical protein
MQGNSQNENVVSLFAAKNKAKDEESKVEVKAEDQESFSDVMERNMKNKERIEKERLNANKSVLRSYRIKH